MLLSHLVLHCVVSFSNFLIFLVICREIQTVNKQKSSDTQTGMGMKNQLHYTVITLKDNKPVLLT